MTTRQARAEQLDDLLQREKQLDAAFFGPRDECPCLIGAGKKVVLS